MLNLEKALASPITHREALNSLVCAKCKERLDRLIENVKACSNDTSLGLLLTKPLTKLELAYILSRKGIMSETIAKINNVSTFTWGK